MIGPPRPIDHLSTEDLLEIADGVVDDGVVDDVQVRDLGLLASAAARPRATVFGRDAYPTPADQAGALMHSLARNHPSVDGNERLAWSATRIFCLLDGTDLVMSTDDAERMVLAVATGELGTTELAETIGRHLT